MDDSQAIGIVAILWPTDDFSDVKGPCDTDVVVDLSSASFAELLRPDSCDTERRLPKGVTAEVIGRVMSRVFIASPRSVSQADIANGSMLQRQTTLPPSTVNRVVKYLTREDVALLRSQKMTSDGTGRAHIPLSLAGDSWASIGIDIRQRAPGGVSVFGVLTALDDTTIDGGSPAGIPVDLGPDDDLLDYLEGFVLEMQKRAQSGSRRVLGIGLSVRGHVAGGRVVSHSASWTQPDLPIRLRARVDLPVVIENDVNVRALRLSYNSKFDERDFALVAVLGAGVGGAIVIDGRLYRGATGSAGEVGHVEVHSPALSGSAGEGGDGFAAPCSCSGADAPRMSHCECFATSPRIAAELGVAQHDLLEIGRTALMTQDFGLTDVAKVFHRAGVGLGLGLVALLNIVNPGRLVLLLPAELCAAAPGTAATAYVGAVRSTIRQAFSTAAHDAHVDDGLWIEPIDSSAIARDGAEAAATSVLHALIEEASGRVNSDVHVER